MGGTNIFPHMKAIQILMDERLVEAADRAARRLRVDRSKLVRTALQRFLREQRTADLEERYRRAHERPMTAQERKELRAWESIQEWPED